MRCAVSWESPCLMAHSMPTVPEVCRLRRFGEHSSKLQDTGMADHDRARFRRCPRPNLAKGRAHLVNHDIDDVAWTFGPQSCEGPEERLAGKRQIRAQRERAHDIESRTNAGIEHHRGTLADRALYRRQCVDRGRQSFDLAPAMVRDDDRVDPERHAFFRIRWMQNSLDDKLPLPALPV